MSELTEFQTEINMRDKQLIMEAVRRINSENQFYDWTIQENGVVRDWHGKTENVDLLVKIGKLDGYGIGFKWEHGMVRVICDSMMLHHAEYLKEKYAEVAIERILRKRGYIVQKHNIKDRKFAFVGRRA
jgi:hypothetical protein